MVYFIIEKSPCHQKSAQYKPSLRYKPSFLTDTNSILVNHHLKLSWFTELLKFPQTKYGQWSSYTVSNDTVSLDGYHPNCENLNLILKTGRNSSRIYGWVAWGEEALKPKKWVLKVKLWAVAPACDWWQKIWLHLHEVYVMLIRQPSWRTTCRNTSMSNPEWPNTALQCV